MTPISFSHADDGRYLTGDELPLSELFANKITCPYCEDYYRISSKKASIFHKSNSYILGNLIKIVLLIVVFMLLDLATISYLLVKVIYDTKFVKFSILLLF